MAESLEVLDSVRLHFSSSSLLLMNITLAFIMFGVALDINTKQFHEILLKPKPVIIGFISQFFLLPAVTFLMVITIKPPASVALGMILVSCCPGGNISNFVSLLAKGNAALSIILTAIATIGAIFLTPLNFMLWGSLYSKASNLLMPIEIDPWRMLRIVFILLAVPLFVGFWFAYKFFYITRKIIKPIKIISIICFAGFVVAAFSSNFQYFLKYIQLIFLIVLIHNALALLTGFSISSLFKLQRKNRRSVTIETGIQNSGLALVLIFNPKLFDGLGGMAFIAAWWGIWHLIAGLSLAGLWSMKPLRSTKSAMGFYQKS